DLQDDWGTNLAAGIDFDEIRITHNFSGLSQFILTGLGANTSSVATVNTYLTGRNLFTCSGTPANCVASSTIAGGGVDETGGNPPIPLLADPGGGGADNGAARVGPATIRAAPAAAGPGWVAAEQARADPADGARCR